MKKVNYKYQIGDIITDVKSGKLEILEQIRIIHHRKNKNDTYDKGYKYRCLMCGNEDIIDEYNLKKHIGCNVCCITHRKVLKGYNDIWTTNPELAKLLADPNDGYKYTQFSEKRIDFKCPNCGNIVKNRMISGISKNGLSCPKCGDKISYTEKIMYSVLQQLNVEFTYQYKPKWCTYKLKNKLRQGRYDFCFKLNNEEYIIETDGNWHNTDNSISGQTKEESKYIDDEKDKLADKHNIEVIRIDCDISDLEYIKDKILDSKLNRLFDLSKIDWLQCHKFACNSLVKKICDLWQKSCNIILISKMTKLDKTTIRKYLKQGALLSWCNYDPKEEYKKSLDKMHMANTKKVICLNNKKIFNSIKDISEKHNIDASSISSCCKGKRKSAGKDPITKEKLRWMYYEDYIQEK